MRPFDEKLGPTAIALIKYLFLFLIKTKSKIGHKGLSIYLIMTYII